MHAGSAATQSKAGPAEGPAKQRAASRPAQAESTGQAPVFYESQQSFHDGAGAGTKRSRKASCVELPIHQVIMSCWLQAACSVSRAQPEVRKE